MTLAQDTPKIRFQRFPNKWTLHELGDFTIWASGGTPSKSVEDYWNGEIPWISASSMRGSVYYDSELKISEAGLIKGSKLAPKGSLLILVRGSMLYNTIPIGIAGKDVAFNQDVKSIQVQKESFPEFIFYWFKHIEPKILNMVTGTGIGAGKLELSELKELNVKLPEFEEQQKIASFFTAIDRKLTQLKKKKELLEQYKKGIMQKIFSQEIRFKDEQGEDFPDWEEKRLGDCLDYEQPTPYLVQSTEYDNSYPIPVITAGKTFILGYTNEKEGVYKDNLPVIVFDDFTTASQFVYFQFKAKSSAMKILKSKGKNNIKFFFELLQMIKFEIGAHGRHWISVFQDLFIVCPSEKEQAKIANFLSAIDKKIEYTQTQIDKTEQWKKGLLQQMFV